MLKKLLAGLTVIALSLGMVALTAGPASAHHNTIAATVSCNTGPEGTWKVTWTVKNSESIPEMITASSDTSIVAKDTVINGGQTLTVVKYFTTKPASDFKLTLSSKWTNNQTATNEGWLYKDDFKADCLPDDTKTTKIWICHANEGNNGFTRNQVDYDSIIKQGGHAVHQNGRDVIPSFSYTKQGVPGTFGGLNWNPPYSQWFLDNGCSDDVSKPAAPTKVEAVCTAVGASAGSATIPSGVVGYQYAYRYGTSGGWTDVAQGTVLPNLAFGTVVQVRATVLSGYDAPDYWGNEWNGYGDSRYAQLTIGGTNSSKCIAAVAPSFQDAVCTAPGTGTTSGYYVVNGVAGGHVTYEVKVGNGGWSTVLSNTYGQQITVAAGTKVEVRATAETGYQLVGYTPWPAHTFGNPGDCLDEVTPVAPSFQNALCVEPGTGTTSGYYVVNGVVGGHVTYEVKVGNGVWATVLPNSYGQQVPVAPGSVVEVRAIAEAGYKLVGYTPWPAHTFGDPGDCLDDATPVAPSFQNALCVDPGTGTTSGYYVVNGVVGGHVVYEVRIDGGSWTVVDPATFGVKIDKAPGTVVEIRASAADGYTLVRYTPWPAHTFGDPGDCLDEAFPGDPTFVDSVCEANSTGSTQATYEIVAAQNVTYQVSTDGVTYTTAGASVGIHDATPGTHIWVKAIPLPGYTISGQTIWDHVFANPGTCLDDVAVQPVVATDQVCVIDDDQTLAAHLESGAIAIPSTPHVTYSVNGTVKATGVHNYAPGVYTISAAADPGYQLTGVPTPWTVEIKEAKLCGDLETKGVVTPIVSRVQTTCSASGSYTLGVMVDDDPAAVIWTVSGGLPNTIGTHKVTTAGQVTITATAAPGFGLSGDQDGIMEWSYDFVTFPDGCLPTLALTGGSVAAGGLGVTALLTLGGILLLAARKRDVIEH